MKRVLIAVSAFFLMLSSTEACVGKLLFIGALNSAQEQVLAEMLRALVNERTGTTIKIKYFNSTKDLYNAVSRKEVNILLENTERSMEILGKKRENNAATAYNISKEEFRKSLGLVWLEPFTPLSDNSGRSHFSYVPVISADVLTNFPALPRVIKKLSGILSNDVVTKFLEAFKTGEKPEKIARDFLKSKKLI